MSSIQVNSFNGACVFAKISSLFQLNSALAYVQSMHAMHLIRPVCFFFFDGYWCKIIIPERYYRIFDYFHVSIMSSIIDYECVYNCAINNGSEIYLISVNNPVNDSRIKNIIIDDGIGAYRVNPFLLYHVLEQEQIFLERSPVKKCRAYMIIALSMLIFKRLFNNGLHFGIFIRPTFPKIKVNKIFKENYKLVLSKLSELQTYSDLKADQTLLVNKKIILYLPTPSNIKSDNKSAFFVKLLKKYAVNNNLILKIKPHPSDKTVYMCSDLIDFDGTADEYIFINSISIEFVVGEYSTALWISRFILDIKTFRLTKIYMGDYNIDRIFRYHIPILEMS